MESHNIVVAMRLNSNFFAIATLTIAFSGNLACGGFDTFCHNWGGEDDKEDGRHYHVNGSSKEVNRMMFVVVRSSLTPQVGITATSVTSPEGTCFLR